MLSTGNTDTDVLTTVTTAVRDLLEETVGESDRVGPDDALFDLGLNSLTLARLIIRLESDTGVDPFAQGASLADVRTVTDLARLYTEAAATPAT
jgi:acyl carrier protein